MSLYASQQDLIDTTGYVYLIYAPEVDRVKIGFAKNPRRRLMALETASPVRLQLAGQIVGSLQDEQELHRRFAKYRVHREWFRAHDEIRIHFGAIEFMPDVRPERQPNYAIMETWRRK